MGRQGPGTLCPPPHTTSSGTLVQVAGRCSGREPSRVSGRGPASLPDVAPGRTRGPRPPFPRLPHVAVPVSCGLPPLRVTRRLVARHGASGHRFNGQITRKRYKNERPRGAALTPQDVGARAAAGARGAAVGMRTRASRTRTGVDSDAAAVTPSPPPGARSQAREGRQRARGPRGLLTSCAGSAGAPDVVGGDRSRSSGPHMPSRGGKRRVRVLCPPGRLRQLLPEGPAGARRPGPLVHHLLLPGTRPSGAHAAGVRAGASRGAAAARPALAARGTGPRVAIEPLKLPEASASVHCGRAWGPGPAVPEAPGGARARTRRGSRPAGAALGGANAEAAVGGRRGRRVLKT